MMRVINRLNVALVLVTGSLLAQNADDSLLKGMEAFHQGRYAEAREALQKAPENARSRTFLALTRAAMNACAEASGDLRTQFRTNSEPELRRLAGVALVQCQLNQNQFEDVFTTTAELEKAFPGDADVLYEVCKVHMKAWNDAVFRMFQKTPSSYRVNQLSGEVFQTQGRYAEAAGEYRKAIQKSPAALNLHYRLGRALLLESHEPKALEEARTEFEAELRLNPGDAAAEYQVAQLLAAQQNSAEAQAHYQKAVGINPNFPEALVALGKIELEQKHYDDAIRLFQRAADAQPAMEAPHYNLMLAYRNAGRMQDATREKAVLDKLQKPPEGEFTEFLKKLGEKAPKQ
jgi:tetratricopeptide (TPR) repeat protein